MLAFLFEHNKAEDVWFLNYKYIISIKTIKKNVKVPQKQLMGELTYRNMCLYFKAICQTNQQGNCLKSNHIF